MSRCQKIQAVDLDSFGSIKDNNCYSYNIGPKYQDRSRANVISKLQPEFRNSLAGVMAVPRVKKYPNFISVVKEKTMQENVIRNDHRKILRL